MSNTDPYLFAPANTMTKLEAVAVDLFARQMINRSDVLLAINPEQVAGWAIESAVVILTKTDEYQRQNDPMCLKTRELQIRIARASVEKVLLGKRLDDILFGRYGVATVQELDPGGLVDLAEYLDTL